LISFSARSLVAFACALALAPQAVAAKPKWDRAKNIKEAGVYIANMQRRQGAPAVVKYLEACYKTHTLSSEFTSSVETCVAQDYIFTQALALVYSRIPQAERAKLGVPEPAILAQAMGTRIDGTFAQYKISKDDALEIKSLVDKHGFPAFAKIAFPDKPGSEEKTPEPKSEKK
jgi:hypothetical protein